MADTPQWRLGEIAGWLVDLCGDAPVTFRPRRSVTDPLFIEWVPRVDDKEASA